MNEDNFSELINKFEGLNWLVFGGLAVAVYTRKPRKINDIDFAVQENEIHEIGKRLNAKVKKRHIEKGDFSIDDLGIETEFLGTEIEVTNKVPKELFDRKVKKNYLNEEIYVDPIENLIALKALIGRDKDIKDLRLMLGNDIDKDFLMKQIEHFGKKDKIVKTLKQIGFGI